MATTWVIYDSYMANELIKELFCHEISFVAIYAFLLWKKLDCNFLLVKEDNYEVCQVGDLRLLRGLRDRQGAGGGEGDEEGGQRYQSKELDE